MNKRDLIDACASHVDVTKTAIEQVIDYLTVTLGNELIKNGYTKIPNLGSLSVQNRQSRNYYDMNSGDIKRSKQLNTIKFQPSSELKRLIQRRNYD